MAVWRPFLWGRNPRKTNLSQGRPLSTSAGKEDKPVAGQATVYKRRHKGRGPGKGLDGDAVLYSLTHQQETRVADARCAGIGHQGDDLPAEQTFDHPMECLVLVKDMVRLQGCGYAVMLHHHPRGAGILRQDEVCPLQHLDGTESHVAEVAYRSGD